VRARSARLVSAPERNLLFPPWGVAASVVYNHGGLPSAERPPSASLRGIRLGFGLHVTGLLRGLCLLATQDNHCGHPSDAIQARESAAVRRAPQQRAAGVRVKCKCIFVRQAATCMAAGCACGSLRVFSRSLYGALLLVCMCSCSGGAAFDVGPPARGEPCRPGAGSFYIVTSVWNRVRLPLLSLIHIRAAHGYSPQLTITATVEVAAASRRLPCAGPRRQA